MLIPLRKVIHTLLFNFSLFLFLMIAIQNSSNKSKVNFIINETVLLPTSFIIGVSFICGSFTSSLLTLNLGKKQE